MNPDRHGHHSRGEVIADAVVHGLGVIASLIAVPALLALALPQVPAAAGASLVVYGLALILMFSASAAYHMIPHLAWKPALRRFDQAAIFMKIAGTYTPLLVVVGGLFAKALLSVVWIAALGGAIGKLAFGHRFERFTVTIYLALGWAGILVAVPLAKTVPANAVLLIVAGGVLYTVGVAFFYLRRLRFQNAIWHGFVLAAAACHFAAVAQAATLPA
jgi:hemolysin III